MGIVVEPGKCPLRTPCDPHAHPLLGGFADGPSPLRRLPRHLLLASLDANLTFLGTGVGGDAACSLVPGIAHPTAYLRDPGVE